MNGVNEALCCSVPMLLFSHQIEQKMIAKRVNELGVGIQMDIKKISSTKLYQISDQLITNTEYKKQAIKYSNLIKAEEKTYHLRAADEILHFKQSG
jgi:UDP:flavonoid glycosyltransferase YjiC (YdhE family)